MTVKQFEPGKLYKLLKHRSFVKDLGVFLISDYEKEHYSHEEINDLPTFFIETGSILCFLKTAINFWRDDWSDTNESSTLYLFLFDNKIIAEVGYYILNRVKEVKTCR
jgi:hypothetical protein